MDAVILKKYHGLGNDYLVLDPNRNRIALNRRAIELLCRRNFGVGADGILYGPVETEGLPGLTIYGRDGSLARQSGNGVRIFAKYLLDEGYVKAQRFCIQTALGPVEAACLAADRGRIRLNMGKPSFAGEAAWTAGMHEEGILHAALCFCDRVYNGACLCTQGPGCVVMMEEVGGPGDIRSGPYGRRDKAAPAYMNLQLVKVPDAKNLQVEIAQRGAEALAEGSVDSVGGGFHGGISSYAPLSSGTRACAAAALTRRMGLCEEEVTVHMPGGSLSVKVCADWTIFLTGPVEYVGEIRVAEEFLT